MPTGKLTQAKALADLGCAPDADPATVLAAYRKLRRQWHPDVCQEPNAHERFVVIQQAKDRLDNWLNGRPDAAPGGADEDILAKASEAWRAARKAHSNVFEPDANPWEARAAQASKESGKQKTAPSSRPFADASDPATAYKAMRPTDQAFGQGNPDSLLALWASPADGRKAISEYLGRGPAGRHMKTQIPPGGALEVVCSTFFASFWASAINALNAGATPAQAALALAAELAEFSSRGWLKGISRAHLARFTLLAHRALWLNGDKRLPALLKPLRAEMAALRMAPAFIERFALFFTISTPGDGALDWSRFFWLPAVMLEIPQKKNGAEEVDWAQTVKKTIVFDRSVEALEEKYLAAWNPHATPAPVGKKGAKRHLRREERARPLFALSVLEHKPLWFGVFAQAGWFDFASSLYERLGLDPWAALFDSSVAIAQEETIAWARQALSAEAIAQRVVSARIANQPLLAQIFEPELLASHQWRELPTECLPPTLRLLASSLPEWMASTKSLRPNPLGALMGSIASADAKTLRRVAHAIGAQSAREFSAGLDEWQKKHSTPESLRVGRQPLAQFLALSAALDEKSRAFSLAALDLAQIRFGCALWDAKDAQGHSVRRWQILVPVEAASVEAGEPSKAG